MDKIKLNDTTFCITYFRDSVERELNLKLLLKHLEDTIDNPTILISYPRVDIKDYHRTKEINELVCLAKTKVVVIQDVDYIIHPEDMVNAEIEALNGYTVCPHSGIVDCTSNFTFNNSAGAYFIRKDIYAEHGGENENFVAWGVEDNEMINRFISFGIPFKTIGKHKGIHNKHPPAPNKCPIGYAHNVKEYERIMHMSYLQRLAEVQSWISTKKLLNTL